MAATASSSTMFSFRSGSGGPRIRASSRQQGCSKLDGVAAWFINGVAAAFFASLDRCSCIRIATEEDFGDDGNDLPLIRNDANSVQQDHRATTYRRKASAVAGKGKRSGTFALED